MALKFLNKKGWHTGSLRNIENVWKAEQKHDAEQKKLEELRKQIQEERERHEFRLLQEQAGLTPKQERLDFLYESGLGVGKTSEGFKALQDPAPAPSSGTAAAGPSGASSNATTPGALFEEKPQSANDAWRKLHTDPLLLIRQREQEALARIKSNPVQMARIRQTMEAEKGEGKKKKDKHKKKHHRDKSSKHDKHSSKSKRSRGHSESEEESEEDERRKEKGGRDEHRSKSKNSSEHSDLEEDIKEREHRTEKRGGDENSYKTKHVRTRSDSEEDNEERHNRKMDRDRDVNLKLERDGRSSRFSSRDSEYTKSEKDDKASRFSSRDSEYTKSERDDRSSRFSSRDSEYTKFDRDGRSSRFSSRDSYATSERDDRSKRPSSRDSEGTRNKERSKDDDEERQNRKGERDSELSKSEGDNPLKLSKHSSSRNYESTMNKEKSRFYEESRCSGMEKAKDMECTRNSAEKSEREGDNHSRYDNQSGNRQEGKEPAERRGSGYNRRPPAPKLTEEERAARLREMQMNAEFHEEQRWKRLKKASEVDAQEAVKDQPSAGQRSFLDDAQKSIYGTEKGGSSTIEESVRRRSYYLQGGTAAAETNAFKR